MSERCAVIDCPNGPRWRPVLVLRPWKGSVPIRAEVGLAVCEAHRRDSKYGQVSAYLSDEGFEMICAPIRAMGKAVPARALTELDWIDLAAGGPAVDA